MGGWYYKRTADRKRQRAVGKWLSICQWSKCIQTENSVAGIADLLRRSIPLFWMLRLVGRIHPPIHDPGIRSQYRLFHGFDRYVSSTDLDFLTALAVVWLTPITKGLMWMEFLKKRSFHPWMAWNPSTDTRIVISTGWLNSKTKWPCGSPTSNNSSVIADSIFSLWSAYFDLLIVAIFSSSSSLLCSAIMASRRFWKRSWPGEYSAKIVPESQWV